MCQIPLKTQIASEIESLQKELDDEFRIYHELTHPKVVALSQKLDKKILEYQKLKLEYKHTSYCDSELVRN